MQFSIVVVCLNPGEKLKKTMESILQQSLGDYEVVVKDGGSQDSSVERLKQLDRIREDDRIRIIAKPDRGIYDAMNQAVALSRGEYILFLNCGDTFYDSQVLERTSGFIRQADGRGQDARLLYGNTFCERTGSMVHAAPRISGFTCYRNIPCHQSCFYARELFDGRAFETAFKIRADYDHFLWCYYEKKVNPAYMDMTVAVYEGAGFSENPGNRKRDREEHELITERYMSRLDILKYKFYMAMTLAPFRRWLAENSSFAGIYHKAKDKLYSGRKK